MYRNTSGYADPVMSAVISNENSPEEIERRKQEKRDRRAQETLDTVRSILRLTGFELGGPLKIIDRYSRKEYH